LDRKESCGRQNIKNAQHTLNIDLNENEFKSQQVRVSTAVETKIIWHKFRR